MYGVFVSDQSDKDFRGMYKKPPKVFNPINGPMSKRVRDIEFRSKS